ncbi:hypothetical protein KY290_005527 [Solanum tuberosum]|uniref:Uncharacterized protein n=1 Tax=Solanum tuberosum TaxID=4113 RepID=A0ABQ7WGI3_SOLTU|nr:hypothetical protein KY289_005915 [Solanum tuberosum]KAH0752310.1 hypothetical protein KY285_005458 [Solanum tuberosum]KAH0779100.1 hypothetical protein KY290_005527 [Solanum tuberosum]
MSSLRNSIPYLPYVNHVSVLAGEVDCLVGKLLESNGTWMGDVELRRRVTQKNECHQKVVGIPRMRRHVG